MVQRSSRKRLCNVHDSKTTFVQPRDTSSTLNCDKIGCHLEDHEK